MKTWRKSLICLISFLICFFGEIVINVACGPEPDPYDYYISFFHNNLSQTGAYRPFTFTSYSFLYSDEEPVDEHKLNASEWAAYLTHNTTTADVEQAMYKLNGKTDTLLNGGYLVNKSQLPDSLAGNTFLKNLSLNKGAFKYYGFTKEIEPLVNYAANYWDPKPVDTLALTQAAKEAVRFATTTNDKFIKLRYYYQTQRLYHYSAQYKQAAKLYDKHIGNYYSNSHIKSWALALRAGEERRIGDTSKAAYLFSKVFAGCPERRVQAYRNYKAIDAPVSAILNITKTDEEKATIYAIESFGNPKPDVKALSNIYDCQPASPLISVLITREINKLEEYYLTQKLTDPQTPIMNSFYGLDWTNKEKSATAQIKKLDEFCIRIAAERKNPEYAIGNLASAYLGWMQKNTAKGNYELKKLNGIKLPEKFESQKQIIKLLLLSQGMQAKGKLNETELLPSLKWLEGKVRAETIGYYKKYPEEDRYNYNAEERRFATTARNFYHAVLAPVYLKQRDTAMAALAMITGDIPSEKLDLSYETTDFLQNFLHSTAFVKVIHWRNNRPTAPYLKFLTQKISVTNPNWLYELLGTSLLREHKYDKAVVAFGHTSKKLYTLTDSSDPFISQLADYPKIYQDALKYSYNKLDFAKAMAKLQQQMSTRPTASACFKYATGLYNTGMHGNSWNLISYNWSATDVGREDKYYYDIDYIRSLTAEKYYLEARSLSNNAEFKAKCTFMAAKCQQKQVDHQLYKHTFGYRYNAASKSYDIAVRQNPYFRELRNNYRSTAFFKRAVNECSYLNDFINARMKVGR